MTFKQIENSPLGQPRFEVTDSLGEKRIVYRAGGRWVGRAADIAVVTGKAAPKAPDGFVTVDQLNAAVLAAAKQGAQDAIDAFKASQAPATPAPTPAK